MATTIIRPDAISSDTGFDSTGATLLGLINDSDEGTGATQSNITANATMTFQNGAYSGTINSVITSITAQTSGRASSTEITVKLMDGDGTTLQTDAHVINAADGSITKSNDPYTTNLSVGLVDGLQATITPNNAGCILQEVFITVDFTAAVAASGGKITLSSGKITLSSGKITL